MLHSSDYSCNTNITEAQFDKKKKENTICHLYSMQRIENCQYYITEMLEYEYYWNV